MNPRANGKQERAESKACREMVRIEWPSLGEICLCVINDGVLILDGSAYEAPLKSGKYLATSFGSDSLLLTECTSESSQLLSEFSRGICLFEGPFHIQAHILRPSRIRQQNHTGRKDSALPSMSSKESRVLPESQRLHNGGMGCNLPPLAKPTICLCRHSAHNGHRNNSTHSVFRRFVRSLVQITTKSAKRTGGAK